MGLHVLVVDDDADSRELMTQLLKRAGAAAAVAGSAAEALAAIDRNVPDVLLSDIGMPVQDGYELLRLVRERGGAAAALPAIAVTAYAGVQDRAHALAAGFDDHLPKPVMAEALIAAIARVASQRE
jgi:CheY-like chemotaxis protein